MDAKCSICGAPAERQFTEIAGGRKRSMPLCLDCASKQDLVVPPSPGGPAAFKVKLKAQVLGSGLPATTLRCPECGIRLVELRKAGRLGCPHCYEVFRKHHLDHHDHPARCARELRRRSGNHLRFPILPTPSADSA